VLAFLQYEQQNYFIFTCTNKVEYRNFQLFPEKGGVLIIRNSMVASWPNPEEVLQHHVILDSPSSFTNCHSKIGNLLECC